MADKTFDTLCPQDTDSDYDLRARQARALSEVQGRLAQGAGTLAGGVCTSVGAPLLLASPGRRKWGVQNAGTNPLTVLIGGVAAIDLRGGSALNAGDGGRVEDADWKGEVWVNGLGPRYSWFEE